MAETVKVYEAKTHLSALLSRVEAGETIVIARGDRVVAELAPHQPAATREMGFLDFDVPDSFFEPLPEEELALWEGAEA